MHPAAGYAEITEGLKEINPTGLELSGLEKKDDFFFNF
ncbi:hypothetical protein FLACOL7796_03149 [Flavobacterium collinsii]|jgi:hypothetical protein|uniref:Uncharacterized protein n=1 Tax=Flavobacterium collinsii TaxID=1114861 RepID=A0ABN7EM22_9FLAO|nr:hypothetical protein FLACOL7796_03149 [Flavobacterium collinsii]